MEVSVFRTGYNLLSGKDGFYNWDEGTFLKTRKEHKPRHFGKEMEREFKLNKRFVILSELDKIMLTIGKYI